MPIYHNGKDVTQKLRDDIKKENAKNPPQKGSLADMLILHPALDIKDCSIKQEDS